jgi:mRNA-degrading endonuclease RelE of RelBE toxin-antitoxin system
MRFERTEDFNKEVKKLAKKYKSILKDLEILFESLDNNPKQGDALGDSCYKVRMPIASKNKGKSAGARVITCVKIIEDTIHLLYIFDKSDFGNISDGFLDELKKTIK